LLNIDQNSAFSPISIHAKMIREEQTP